MIDPKLAETFKLSTLAAPVATAYEQIVENHGLEPNVIAPFLIDLLAIDITYKQERAQINARKRANFKWPNAMLENVPTDESSPFSEKDIQRLMACEWVKDKFNVLLIGASGLGKTTSASAIGNCLLLKGYSTIFLKYRKFIHELVQAERDGVTEKYINKLNKKDVLIVDDWRLTPLSEEERLLLFNFVEEREGKGCWVITSQFDVSDWHKAAGAEYISDSIFDRIGHTPLKFTFKEAHDSFRKLNAQKGAHYD